MTAINEPVSSAGQAPATTTPSRRAGLRDDIAAAMREHYLSTNRADADADRNMPCVCGDWREPGAEADDENDWDSHLADAVLAVLYREWPWLRAEAEDASASVSSAEMVAVDQTALRDRIAATVDEAFQSFDPEVTEDAELAGHLADAVLAVLPATAECAECQERAAVDIDDLRRSRYRCLRRAEAAEAEVERLRADRAAVLREAADVLEARRCSPESVDIVLRLIGERLCDTCKGYGQTATPTEDGGIVRRCRDCDGKGLRRMADETEPAETQPDTCRSVVVDGQTISVRGSGVLAEQDLAFFGEVVRAAKRRYAAEHPDEPAVEEQQDDPWPVKEATRRYAEELRSKSSTVVADGHAGWACDAGAQLLISATTPGPGALGTHHGTIYACPSHQGAALQRITGAGYEADPRPAPPGHRWNPWPCGHVTAHDADALTALTAAGARQDGEA